MFRNTPAARRIGGPRWDNDGDKAVLKKAAGTSVEICQYAGASSDI